MSTAQIWIDETREMLLSGYVEELLLVAAPAVENATNTAFEISGTASSGIVPGVVIEIGTELMYVQTVTGTTVTVIRGYGGSTASANGHAVDSIVRVSPKFPSHRIISALNDDLADLSAPNNGLFQMRTTTFTYNASVDGYNLDTSGKEILSVYSVTYADIGSEASEPDVMNWRLKRNRETASFASGNALILYTGAWPGQKVNVTYKSPFDSISSGSTLRADTGLPTTAYDLLPLGAALSLMTAMPIRREFIDAQGSSRRAEEVPPGAISASMRDLRSRRDYRVQSEAARLVAQYPAMWSRNSANRPSSQWSGFRRDL
jgi:hypothetical protein|tara:strand:+ start:1627 stop:2580 length:954 start_codon:yes stop_codon:yes gene_type:complete